MRHSSALFMLNGLLLAGLSLLNAPAPANAADATREVALERPCALADLHAEPKSFLGKTVTVTGAVRTSRSGAILFEAGGTDQRISLVGTTGVVLMALPDGQPLPGDYRIRGVVRAAKGFNLTDGLGLEPVTIEPLR